jgi:succinoglycan biosynthesis protein ExoA
MSADAIPTTQTLEIPKAAALIEGDARPFVSIVVLCRNEKRFIEGCLDSLIANDYPKNLLEVLVADGMSEDGTREIVEAYSEKYSFVRLVDNPKIIPAAAANVGIRAAKGDIVMIAGAHAEYSNDYISQCVSYMQSCPAAANVGGVRKTVPREENIVGKSIAYVSLHRFGAGPAAYHHRGVEPSWVDTVWGGCFRKELFEKIGLYNEALVIGEDREMNERIRRTGGKILLVPEINCTYYSRSKFLEYCRWVFRMGFWPFYAGKIVGRPLVALKNFVPLAFVAGLIATLVASFFTRVGLFALVGILSLYVLAALSSAWALVKKERDVRYIALTPFLFGLTHVLYGLGSMTAILKPIPSTSANG